MKKLYAFIGVAVLVTACATNPLTGRQSLALVPNSEIIPQAFAQYNTVLQESKVVQNTSQSQMIKSVGARLQQAAERFYVNNGIDNQLQGYQWEFNLIQDDQLNAWCMPGGKVAFYTGILPVCVDNTGVAVVMGHEIAHALAGHGAERMSQGLIAQGVMLGGNVAISNEQWRNTFNQLYPLGAQVTILSYSRKQELDADKAGLFLMAMAGFDPRKAPEFWNRMEAATAGESRPPEFLSTHPEPAHRRSDLQTYMDEALQYYFAAGGKP